MLSLRERYGGLKKEIYILFIGKVVTAMGSFVFPMLSLFLTVKLGMSDALATLLIATSGVLSFPASILGGKLADKFSRKTIIVTFDLLTVTFYVLSALLPFGTHTAVLIFFAGLFQTIESPAYDALNADFSTSAAREKAFSLSYLGFNLGYIVGASLSGILFENYTFLVFLLNAASIFCSTVLIFFFVHMENAVGGGEEEDEDALGEYELPVDPARSTFSILRERKVVLWMMLVGCVASMPSSLIGIILPLQLKETPEIYGYLNSLNGLTVIILTPLLTILLERVTEIPKTIAGLVFFLSGSLFFALTGEIFLLFLGMFVFTVGEVVSVLGQNPYTSRRIPASHRGRVGGVASVVYSIFGALTQYLVSFILYRTESNYTLIWLVFIGIGAVGVVLYGLLYRPDRKTFPKLYERGGKR